MKVLTIIFLFRYSAAVYVVYTGDVNVSGQQILEGAIEVWGRRPEKAVSSVWVFYPLDCSK